MKSHRKEQKTIEHDIYKIETSGTGPRGKLPINEEWLLKRPSGDLFGLTQNAGMRWPVKELDRQQYLIVSTLGGMRDANGNPVALGYHTGHWELDSLVKVAAEEFCRLKVLPFSVYCSDPCDGRTQGTTGMFDSLPYRNDAAIVMRRLIRSLPTRDGVMGVATCDKGLPAMMMALAAMSDLPCIVVPGGVTLPPRKGEDAGKVQSLGARYAHGLISLEKAAELGCRACGSPGGGCQFLGTAATSQVVGEALGLSLPHSALTPSGQGVWYDMAIQSARALVAMKQQGLTMRKILTQESIENAMAVHAAFGGSTNLLLHLPAIAHAAGLKRPVVEDWIRINRRAPRLVDVLPNGPQGHPTVRVFLAGGVPEVMLHLRDLGVIHTQAMTVTGKTWNQVLDNWEKSERRRRFRQLLMEQDGVNPAEVIFRPECAKEQGLSSTLTFPTGNIAPEGAVVKSTAIDPTLIDAEGVYRLEGPAKVFTRERDAILAIKKGKITAGDIMVLMGGGPLGTGMEETYQVTSALKHIPFGKKVALVTDARFSGVSTGACIGHVGPEALAGGPIGRLRDGDIIRILIDSRQLLGSIDFVADGSRRYDRADGLSALLQRPPHPELCPHESLTDDTRLWAFMQQFGGGAWGGCVYDLKSIACAYSKKESDGK